MKNCKNWVRINLIITSILLIVVFIYIAFECLDYQRTPYNREQVLALIGVIFQFALAISGIIALIRYFESTGWKKKEGLELYLEIQEKNDNGLILAKTFVENKSKKYIVIKSAYLEIKKHGSSECIKRFDLDYYTNSNIHVSNEKLKYVKPIDIIKDSQNPETYDLWFYIHTEKGLYRIIQSCFKAELNINSRDNIDTQIPKNKKS